MDHLPRFFLRSVAQRVLFVTSFALLALFILPAISHAATVSRYWILGPGNWDDTAHWSLSTGGAGGASAPVAGQEAHFDRYSGGGTVTLNAAVDVSGLHLSSAYTGTLLQTSNKITVGTGNLMIGSGRILGGTAALSLSGSYTQTGGIVSHQNTFRKSHCHQTRQYHQSRDFLHIDRDNGLRWQSGSEPHSGRWRNALPENGDSQ